MCNLNKIIDHYEKIDNYKEITERGIQGFISNLDQFVTTEYNREFSELKYVTTLEETILFLNG